MKYEEFLDKNRKLTLNGEFFLHKSNIFQAKDNCSPNKIAVLGVCKFKVEQR